MSDLTDKLEDAINTVADKAREYGEIARLQALIKAEEAKKQKYFYQLGKKYYELYKDAPASDLAEFMNKLVAADEKISDFKEDLKTATAKEPEEAEDDGECATCTADASEEAADGAAGCCAGTEDASESSDFDEPA